MQASAPGLSPRIVGRYALFGEIAAGGMATVHFGRLVGAVGFSRTVAIKRLHPQYAKDPDFVQMFLDEARLAARIHHPNVVDTLDVVPLDGEVFLVMEYVHGEALSKLIRAARKRGELVPPRVAVAILAGALHGLHAAHEAKSERGDPLNLVHRDISPQNILVGTDGVPRVLDFGVAKAAARVTSTRDGQMKGKVSYMSPEQLRGRGVDRRTDVFAAGIVLWEALTGRRLFDGDDPGAVLTKLLELPIPPPSTVESTIPAALDAIVMRALDRDINGRWATAREMAIALERVGTIALPREVGEWVEDIGAETITQRAAMVAEVESVGSGGLPTVTVPAVSVPSSAVALGSSPTHPSPVAAVPISWPLGAQRPTQSGEPTTSPSQVSHVTGVSRPSGVSSPSQASHLSSPSLVTSPSQVAHRPAKQRGVFAALLGVAAALALALVVVTILLFGRHKAAVGDPGIESIPGPKPTVSSEPTAVVVSPPPSAESPVVSPEQLPSADPEVKKPPPKVPRTWRPPPPKPDCDPPFVVDKNGVRRIKPGCA